MPNGYDRNWVRVIVTLEGFRAKHGKWPTRLRVRQAILQNLRDFLFTPDSFRRIEEKLEIVVGENAIIAENAEGQKYRYGEERRMPVERAQEWLGVRPDRQHEGFDKYW